MLFKPKNRPAIPEIILTSLLALLTSCGNNATLENIVRADPKLTGNTSEQPSNQINPQTISPQESNSSPPPSQDSLSPTPELTEEPVISQNQKIDNNNSDQKPPAAAQDDDFSLNFPESFPIYPQAKLKESKSEQDNNSGLLVWQTPDNRQNVADYYQEKLLVNDWDIIKPFTINPQQKVARAIAIKDQLRIELTILKLASQQQSEGQNTQLALSYRPAAQDAPSSISQAIEYADPSQSKDTVTDSFNPQADLETDEPHRQFQDEFLTESLELTKSESIDPSEASNNYFDSSSDHFADLDQVPEQLQKPLESVAALSILTPYTGKSNVELTKFAPNEVITRGEYARWLIAANNRYYRDNPGKKIYLAANTNEPAFNDVKVNHPDFQAIESLAEAGLIPSRLTEDSTNVLFKPNAPLTREDLIMWKVPLDTRKSLPQASIQAIEESWGFQDVADIDSSAIRASYADFQNGDRSNIRRIFGYTTLFQPKKPVTRAEAAASLWYFGFQGDGVTAKEVLELESELESDK